MSFFQSIKRAFGFGYDSEDYLEDDSTDATVVPLRNRTHEENDENSSDTADESCEVESEFLSTVSPDIIFTEVLAVFNSNLPTFIKDSIDPEEQRRQLYECMSGSVKDYLRKIEEETEKKISAKWERERLSLKKEIESLKGKIERAEEGEQNSKKNQLSAERQKRAMNERLHDLEAQVASLQAEHEQYDLENKSLVNKLRAASIYEEDNNALREQISSLSEQLKKGQSPALSEDELAEIKSLREKAAELEKLKEENKSLLKEIELAKAKIEMGTQMMNSQNAIAASAKEELSEKNSEIETLSRRLSAAEETADSAAKEIEVLKSELEEANDKVSQIHEIEQQMLRFEDIKKRKEARISELQKEKSSLAEELRVKDNEVRSLKKTIERNIIEQANSERNLKNEIEMLKSRIPSVAESSEEMAPLVEGQISKSEPKPYNSGRKRKNQVKISAIDDSLDSTDWLVSSAPTTAGGTKDSTDDSFGYVPQVRKPIPDNDAQMLLFD